jgi:hypothetical protein
MVEQAFRDANTSHAPFRVEYGFAVAMGSTVGRLTPRRPE